MFYCSGAHLEELLGVILQFHLGTVWDFTNLLFIHLITRTAFCMHSMMLLCAPLTSTKTKKWLTVLRACSCMCFLETFLHSSHTDDSVLGSSVPSMPSVNGRADFETAILEEEFLQRALNNGTSDSDEDRGYANPVMDDLYARRVLVSEHQTSINAGSDKFLPKYWTPEEDLHVNKIRLGSQRRPWYKKMQGFRFVS